MSGDPEGSLYAAHFQAGKKRVALDLEDPADRRQLLDLLAEATGWHDDGARADFIEAYQQRP